MKAHTTTPTRTARPRGTRQRDVGARVELTAATAEHVTRDLLALAHPVRLRILEILARRAGEVCVCDLERALPVKQPTISHHLRLLREAGLVDAVRRGIWAYYSAEPAAIAALRARVARTLDVLAPEERQVQHG